MNGLFYLIIWKTIVYNVGLRNTTLSVTCEWSISRLVRLAGKSSGFALRLRSFFRVTQAGRPYYAKIVVMAIDNPGMFVIYDFIPSKGWKDDTSHVFGMRIVWTIDKCIFGSVGNEHTILLCCQLILAYSVVVSLLNYSKNVLLVNFVM